jgi:hypothetical protein
MESNLEWNVIMYPVNSLLIPYPHTAHYPRELTGKYAIKIVIQHTRVWNEAENGGENICYILLKHNIIKRM